LDRLPLYEEKPMPYIVVGDDTFTSSNIGTPKRRVSGRSTRISKTKKFEIVRREDIDEGHYEVEAILKKRLARGKLEYLLKWKNWDSKYNSWEPADSLSCPDLLHEFEEQQIREARRANEAREKEAAARARKKRGQKKKKAAK